MIGTTLGSYRILDKLGEGGMGEVYRAHDSTLGREVALKILPDAFAADPERLARFEREARVLASLNHPHIAAIYGVEEAIPSTSSGQAVRALVLELVEGPTLAERLRAGALPVREALEVARQIAEALEAAHEKGVVHRDLKPANVKVTPDGMVKVLDFGIAKMRAPLEDAAVAEASTVTTMGTRPGVVLGTAAYMSPEQARGQAVDKRADIWAFGCVLYEMLTGRSPFARATVTDTIAAVVDGEPDWGRLPGTTPVGVPRLLRRCLEKDPKQRRRDIGDARLELQDTGDREPVGTSPSRRVSPSVLAAAGIATLLSGFVAGAGWWSIARPEAVVAPRGVVRFSVALAPEEVFPLDTGLPNAIAISPDGEQIVYATRSGAGDRLHLRRRDDLTSIPLAGTEGAIGPFFSPDGRSIGFASGGALKIMPVGGGTPQSLAPVANFSGGSWGPDDTIVYTLDWASPLFAVSARGSEPRPLTTLNRDAGEHGHRDVQVLPDGTSALMSLVASEAGRTVEVVDLATGRRQSLVPGHNPFYLASGHLAFAREDALFVAPFDLREHRLTGPPVQVLVGVQAAPLTANLAVSPDGTLAYVPSGAIRPRRLVRVDRDGRSRPLFDETRAFAHPRVSPDGRRVVVQASGEFVVYDLAGGTRTRLHARGSRPIWMPDGRSITFQSQGRLYSAPIDESAAPALVPTQEGVFPLAWSRDGRVLIYSHPVPKTSRDVWTLPAGGTPTPFLTTVRDERAAMFSPDGLWVVYAEKEIGREEVVYVQPYPGPGGRVVISRGGGIEPVWSPTGREIFYRSVDGRRMFAVEVQTEPSISVGAPRVLFEGPYPLGSSFWSDYDVWPDGNEFLMVAADDVGQPELHVVVNWIAEVRRRLAAPE
jgi:eukaryotic-like serine/threonine-protein kinase